MQVLNKIKNSFSFRSKYIYKVLLLLHNKLITLQNIKINDEYDMITLCGSAHIDMLNQSLISLLRTWSEIPKISVYLDGTISLKKAWKKLYKFQSYIVIKEYSNNIAFDEYLKKYANNHVLGKKLSLIIEHGKKKQTIWWDADILWLKSFNFEREFKKGLFLKSTSDYQAAYSKDFYSPLLEKPPFVNTGLFLISGNILGIDGVSQMIEKASKTANHFSEQTILAYALKKTAQETFSLDEIACFQTDTFDLKPSYLNKPWIARHYIGPVRHLFWKDAFFLSFNN